MVCDESIALQLVMHWADALLRALSGAIRLPLPPILPPKSSRPDISHHHTACAQVDLRCIAFERNGYNGMDMLAILNAPR